MYIQEAASGLRLRRRGASNGPACAAWRAMARNGADADQNDTRGIRFWDALGHCFLGMGGPWGCFEGGAQASAGRGQGRQRGAAGFEHIYPMCRVGVWCVVSVH